MAIGRYNGRYIRHIGRYIGGNQTHLQRARVRVEAAHVVKRQRVDRTTVRLVPAHAEHLTRERVPPEDGTEAYTEWGVHSWHSVYGWRGGHAEAAAGHLEELVRRPRTLQRMWVSPSQCSKGSTAREKKSKASGASRASVAARVMPSASRVAPSSVPSRASCERVGPGASG